MRPTPAPICRLRPVLGTFVAIEIPGDTAESERVIEAAFGAISRVEELMHPTRAGSDLSRIAGAAPGQVTTVDRWTSDVLALAQRLHRESDGVFDPCLPSAPGRMHDLELRNLGVTCAKSVALDLGGIAKGFAVDRAVDRLRECGAGSGLVNAGGDLRVFGTVTRTIHARTSDGRALAIPLEEGAVAVSGPRAADSPSGHRGHYRRDTVLPADAMTAVILAPTAVIADALCKCALLCDPGLLGRILEAHCAKLLYTDAPRAQ